MRTEEVQASEGRMTSESDRPHPPYRRRMRRAPADTKSKIYKYRGSSGREKPGNEVNNLMTKLSVVWPTWRGPR